MKYLLILPLLCLTLVLSAQWSMVYENTADGKTLSGDKEKLIKAVRAGKQLRMGWIYFDDDSGEHHTEKFADVELVTILKGDEVFAQLRPVKAEFTKEKKGVIRFNSSVSVYLLSTTDQQLRYKLGEGETGRGRETRLREVDKIQWFVRE